MSDASDGADVLVICGPTAAGKSDVALKLCEATGRSLLVADSRQVYRGFDIGTAKPTPEEQARVRHYGIDLVEPTVRYSAAQWASYADDLISPPLALGVHPERSEGPSRPLALVVVGGTGLYLRALFDGLFREPEADPDRRMSLLDWLDGQPTDELRRWVTELDPSRAALGRTQLLRAIEVAVLSGSRISELHVTEATRPRWRARYLVIDPGSSLHARIERRLDAMLATGWLDEVRRLRAIPDDAPAWKASGYRVLRDVVDGLVSLDEARERILIETRQYAKRQRTWFRHQLPADRVTLLNPEQDDAERVVEQWTTG